MCWIAMARPVHIDRASAVRKIWPPPSPVEPSSSITFISFSFILQDSLGQESVQHACVRPVWINEHLRRGDLELTFDEIVDAVPARARRRFAGAHLHVEQAVDLVQQPSVVERGL